MVGPPLGRTPAPILAAAVAACVFGTAPSLFGQDAFETAIQAAQQRVVKIYGGGIGRVHGYGSGVIVSPDGQIATTASALLEGRSLRVVLPDGRGYAARVVRRDDYREIALLQIDAFDLPYFELGVSEQLQVGDWVISAANPFKVASGPEAVSVSAGVLSARTQLAARRRLRDVPYHGPVLLADVLISTPGAAGGALVDLQGRLVGLIGKPAISRRTNTWLNYALPVEEVAAFVAGRESPTAAVADAAPGEAAGDPALALGIRLLDYGAADQPAFIERIRTDSPAFRAQLRPDDLILSINGERVASCADARRVLRVAAAENSVALIVKRGAELLPLQLDVAEERP